MLTGASIMAYSDDVLRYSSYGKEYEVPRRRVLCFLNFKEEITLFSIGCKVFIVITL